MWLASGQRLFRKEIELDCYLLRLLSLCRFVAFSFWIFLTDRGEESNKVFVL